MKDLLDPELAAPLAQFPKLALSNEILPVIRDPAGLGFEPPAPDPAIALEERRIPGPAGAPAVRTPDGAARSSTCMAAAMSSARPNPTWPTMKPGFANSAP